MSSFAKEFISKSHDPGEVKKGRPSEKINFRSTANPHVARAIVESVLQNPRFLHLKSLFDSIHWGNMSSVNDTFRQLILALEKECK
jgi:hypothetical protein